MIRVRIAADLVIPGAAGHFEGTIVVQSNDAVRVRLDRGDDVWCRHDQIEALASTEGEDE